MDLFSQILDVGDAANLDVNLPQPWLFGTMLIIALTYGVLLNILYTLYFRDSEPLDASLSRSLILLTPTLMTIFWVIQFSLPLSVGLLGTLSFVRFRSPVKRAEDLSFIVIALACSISCAILKPLIGGILIFIVLVYSLIRNYFTIAGVNGKDFAVLTFNTKQKVKIFDMEKVFKTVGCSGYEFISSRAYDGITSYVFNIANLRKTCLEDLTKGLESIDKDSHINMFYPNGRIGG